MLLALALAVGSDTSAAQAGAACGRFDTLSIEGLASGGRVVQGLSNATVFSQADGGAPTAQARVDSVTGSTGRAGAPFSAAAAENMGLAGFDPTGVPVFAISAHPTHPEASQEAPAYSLRATSGPYASTARADTGGGGDEAGSFGRSRASATAECLDDGTIHAVAENVTEGIFVAEALTIASVRSRAEVTIPPGGEPTFDSTIEVHGVSTLGQPAGFDENGLVLGSAIGPLPENPLASALEDAGVTVRYLAPVEDVEDGVVLAPGMEITATYEVPGAGTGPLSTTFTFGQAYVRAGSTSSRVAPASPPAPSTPPPNVTGAAPAVPTAPTAAPPSVADETAAPVAAPQPASSSTTRIAEWSIAAAYYALALGTLLSVAVRGGYRRLAVRLSWT